LRHPIDAIYAILYIIDYDFHLSQKVVGLWNHWCMVTKFFLI